MMQPDHAIVLTLARTPDRLAAFRARLAEAAPLLPECHPYYGHDGQAAPPPPQFDGTPGAWGCWLSHAQIWRHVASQRTRVCVFEDDATFVPDIRPRLTALLAAIPARADLLYLGGQHLVPPLPALHTGGQLVKCRNVNRTHAYILDGASPAVKAAAARITDWARPAARRGANGHHVDYLIGELIERGDLAAYAPAGPWLCGQAAGQSLTTGKVKPHQDWN